jgi:replicative DNA helicase
MDNKNLQLNLMNASNFIGQSNSDVEEAVLATLVNFPETYYKIADQLSQKEFSRIENRYIYSAIKEVSEVSAIDILTVTDKIIQKKYDEAIVGVVKGFSIVTHLEDICERIDSDDHLEKHVSLLNGYAKRRELMKLGNNIVADCNDMKDPMEVMSFISTKIVDIQEMGDVDEFDLLAANKDVYKSLDPRPDNEMIIRSYIDAIDDFIYCFEMTELIIIAGAPSMGKTAFALALFRNFIVNDIPAAFFSLEMGTTQLLSRIYAVESDVGLSKLRRRNLDDQERSRINTSIGEFEKKKFFIDDRSRKISHIANKIRKYVIRHGVKAVFIDYLQLASCDVGNAGNREQEISKISRILKELTNELKIPIFALSQINRAVHSRSNKRPTLGDLRESGAIEQDADMVMFVHRPHYFIIEQALPETESAEIIIAKGRSCGIGTIDVPFQSAKTKFLNSTQDEISTYKQQQLEGLGPLEEKSDEFG